MWQGEIKWLSSHSYWPWKTRIKRESPALSPEERCCQLLEQVGSLFRTSVLSPCSSLLRSGHDPPSLQAISVANALAQRAGCTGTLNSSISPSGMCLAHTSAWAIIMCLESHHGPTLNWEGKCAPFWPPKQAPVIFYNPSEHRHGDVETHLFATLGCNRHTWGNRNFLCEEKYIKQCTAASFGEELEKDTWQFKWYWSYTCTNHQMSFYCSFL